MQKLSTALLIGGLALMPLSAMAQNLASAPNAAPVVVSEHRIFLASDASIPASALETVRTAAEAARQAPIRIEGRADYANAVKRELVRQGAPASAIRIAPVTPPSLARAADGVAVPPERSVVLNF